MPRRTRSSTSRLAAKGSKESLTKNDADPEPKTSSAAASESKSSQPPSDPQINQHVAEITAALKDAGIPSKKEWWEKYLKHEIEFYGVPMADIRRIVKAWVVEHQTTNNDNDSDSDNDNDNNDNDDNRLLLPVAWQLFRQPIAEQKLAAILILQEHALPRNVLQPQRDLPILVRLFDEGFIADWNTTDWLCVRVLGKWMIQDKEQQQVMEEDSEEDHDDTNNNVALQIAAWAKDPHVSLWRQRAALVAFCNNTAETAWHPNILTTAKALIQGPHVQQRFCQTALGWVLRELSQQKQDGGAKKVVEFVQTHQSQMSDEAINMASAKLSDANRAKLGLANGKKKRKR